MACSCSKLKSLIPDRHLNDVTYFQNSITSLKTVPIPLTISNNLKIYKMKKTIFIAILMIFTLSATTTFAGKIEAPAGKTETYATESDSKSKATVTKENKLSTEELSLMKNRVEEIRNIDKSGMTVLEKRELRKESKSIKENIKKDGSGYIYISGGTLVLILVLLIIF